jgi:uncharacterized protein (TIGR00369 family)
MKKQSQSRHCFVCGVQNEFGLKMSFYQIEPGKIESRISVPARFQGYPGIVHGGIIAAMLDEVSGRSIMTDPPRWKVTAQLNIRYRRPVPVETPLHLIGKVISDEGRFARVMGEIYDGAGVLLASAEALLADIPANLQAEAVFETDEWKVYPDEE